MENGGQEEAASSSVAYINDRLGCFLGPSALISILAGRDNTVLCLSKSSKMLSPVAMRLLSKMQDAKVGIIYILYPIPHGFA